MGRVIAFDLDGTLAPSKSTLPPEMGTILAELLKKFEVCVISGGKFGQFQTQLLDGLDVDASLLSKLHLMPTCGTQYYHFQDGEWQQVYAENFTDDQKVKILLALNNSIDTLGFRVRKSYGDIIEDRGSQITFSALGQDIVAQLGDEGVRLKEEWDPTSEKKNALRDHIAAQIPEFEVRVGGGTSIDITLPGIDKAYGMQKLIDILGTQKQDILFFGDRLDEDGNDYPVRNMGIRSQQVVNWQDTATKLQQLLERV
jgi:phosphomannomutase